MSISHNSQNLSLDTKRHSFAHLMAAAVGQMFPEAQYGVGPIIETGCYYDFVLPRPLIPEDLPLIEKKIQHLLKQDLRFKCQELSLEEAINHFANANQPLKVELLENLRDRGTTSMSEEEKADFGGVDNNDLQIVKAEIGDIRGIMKVQYNAMKSSFTDYGIDENELYEECLSEQKYNQYIEWFKTTTYFVTKDKGEVIAVAAIPFDSIIRTVWVEPEFQNMGLGKKLLKHLLDEAFKKFDTLTLSTGHQDNDRAIAFYKKFGFKETGKSDKFKLTPNQKIELDSIEFELNKVDYKVSNLPTITIYRIVNEQTGEVIFEDLCKGPHVEGVRPVKASTQSSTQKTTIDTYNQAASAYIQKTVDEVSGLHQTWLDKTLGLLNKDSAILEIGSATGRDANYIDSKGFHVIRTDVSQSFVDYQLEQGKLIRQMDLLKPSIKEKFDLVLACAVLLHFNLNEFDQALNNVNQLLNLGGIFSFSVKTGEGETQTSHKLDAPRYYNLWKRSELEAKVREFGFEIIEVIENSDIGYIDTDKSYSFNGDKKWLHFICKKIIQLESKKYLQSNVSESLNLQNLGFKLDKFSASYWRGDQARGVNMQRLYALVYESKEELKTFIDAREEAKKFDHRILGQQLDLFSFSELVGAGLPLFSPKGTLLRNTLKSMLFQVSKKYGCQEVTIPHMAKIDLYETSGHAKKFAGELFHVKSHYDIDFVLKPVNCPHHTQIFASKQRSYRDLPLRYIESTMQYRDEKPGAIGGLTRVRSITCDDGHTFCTPDQIKNEILLLCKTIEEFYTNLGMYGNHWVSISVRDYTKLEGYTGFPEDWDKAESMLKEINDELNLGGKVCEGEAAIYGPKLDFMYKDIQGNERQLSTVQLDFATPKRFGLVYKESDGTERPPVMIHRAILGSYERFLAILLESTKGKFPFWLAPEQIRILTINDEVLSYVAKIKAELDETVLMKPLKYNEVRYHVDSRGESLGKKIREAKMDKVPMLIIIGLKDVEENVVSIEYNGESIKVGLDELKGWVEGVK